MEDHLHFVENVNEKLVGNPDLVGGSNDDNAA